MVQAVINIDEQVNRVLNVVKAKYGLKDKSAAINLVVSKFEEDILEPELRPEFVSKMQDLAARGRFKNFKDLATLRKEIEEG